MPWDDLESEILEEFGQHQPGGEDNVFLAQASAMREWRRTRSVAVAQAKVEAGQCRDCEWPAEPGRRRCARCLAAQGADCAIRKARREAIGQCRDCGEPAEPSRSRCARHLAVQNAAVRRRRGAEAAETRT